MLLMWMVTASCGILDVQITGGVKERNQEETRREKGKNYEVSEIYPTIIYESEISEEFYARAMEYILHIQCMDFIHSSIN